MSIAACYVSTEGVVIGTDSRTTILSGKNEVITYHDNAQKLFEVGERGTLAVATWGNGSLGSTSHRAMIESFSADLWENPVGSVAEAAQRLAELAWKLFQPEFSQMATVWDGILKKSPQLSPAACQKLIDNWNRDQTLGYCIGGTWHQNTVPDAYVVLFKPTTAINVAAAPVPTRLVARELHFWGMPSPLKRLIDGFDPYVVDVIMNSKKWTGTKEELIALLDNLKLTPPEELPLREAISWVHGAISATIKAVQFSGLSASCGGPVEVGIVTCDRPFRWVTHKPLESAIT